MVFLAQEKRKSAAAYNAVRDTPKGHRAMIACIVSLCVAASVVPLLLFSVISGAFAGNHFPLGTALIISGILIGLVIGFTARYVSLLREWSSAREDEKIEVEGDILFYSWRPGMANAEGLDNETPRVRQRKVLAARLSHCRVGVDFDSKCYVFEGDVRAAEYDRTDMVLDYSQMFPVPEGKISVPDYFDPGFGAVLEPYISQNITMLSMGF